MSFNLNDIWSREDVFHFTPETGNPERWPAEVMRPVSNGYNIVVIYPGDYRGRSDGNRPAGTLWPKEGGSPENPLYFLYAGQPNEDFNLQKHPKDRHCVSEAIIDAFWIQNYDHTHLYGLSFLDNAKNTLIRNTEYSSINNCYFRNTRSQAIRIRYGANNNLVNNSVFERTGITWPSGDVVGIQVSDGTNLNNIIRGNTILNYTDGFQNTDRSGEPYGVSAGTVIENNYIGFTEEAYELDSEGNVVFKPGCENCLDFKTGGTAENPVIVRNNVLFGTRAGYNSGGYSTVIHNMGTHVHLLGNKIVNCETGIFLNAMYVNRDQSQGWQDSYAVIDDNEFIEIKHHSNKFPTKTGRILVGTNSAKLHRNKFVDCDQFREKDHVRMVLDLQENELYGGDIFLTVEDYLEYLNQNSQVAGTYSQDVVKIGVPFSSFQINHSYPTKVLTKEKPLVININYSGIEPTIVTTKI